MNATGVTAGPAESNGRLMLGRPIWRDSLHVTCGLTACTPGSAPGPTLGNEYGKTLPFLICFRKYPRVTNGRVVQLGRPIADQFSSCAMNKPLLLPMTALANWQATDLYKCGSSLLSLEFVYKILIFAVLQRWLLEQRETGASFVYITTSRPTNVSIFHRSAVPTW